VLKDRPGSLERLVEVLSDQEANIYAIEHDRASRDIAMNDAEVELDLETKGPDHAESVIEALEDSGYEVRVLV
jgi:threonine dehydratase